MGLVKINTKIIHWLNKEIALKKQGKKDIEFSLILCVCKCNILQCRVDVLSFDIL
jgi:hypothetical protein